MARTITHCVMEESAAMKKSGPGKGKKQISGHTLWKPMERGKRDKMLKDQLAAQMGWAGVRWGGEMWVEASSTPLQTRKQKEKKKEPANEKDHVVVKKEATEGGVGEGAGRAGEPTAEGNTQIVVQKKTTKKEKQELVNKFQTFVESQKENDYKQYRILMQKLVQVKQIAETIRTSDWKEGWQAGRAEAFAEAGWIQRRDGTWTAMKRTRLRKKTSLN